MSSIFDLFEKIKSPTASATPIEWLIVGLGNPGAKYEKTRHNVGFMAVDFIAEKCGARIDRSKFKSLVTEVNLAGARVLLMKPETFMNSSGVAIGEAATFYKIPPENVLVLHDEISFDAGLFRIRRKGSAGGHNGLKSIIEHLGSDGFPRIKIGVGQKPSPDYDLVDWVLGKFPKEAEAAITARLDDIHSASELIVRGEIDLAMNRYSK